MVESILCCSISSSLTTTTNIYTSRFGKTRPPTSQTTPPSLHTYCLPLFHSTRRQCSLRRGSTRLIYSFLPEAATSHMNRDMCNTGLCPTDLPQKSNTYLHLYIKLHIPIYSLLIYCIYVYLCAIISAFHLLSFIFYFFAFCSFYLDFNLDLSA